MSLPKCDRTQLLAAQRQAAISGIVAEWQRLGYVDRYDRRAERLAITAELAGLDELRSTNHLSESHAARVFLALHDCRASAELAAVDQRQAAEPGRAITPSPRLPLSIGAAVVLLVYGVTHPAEAGDMFPRAGQAETAGSAQPA